MSIQYTPGQIVAFNFRGRKLQGTVVRQREIVRKRKNQSLAYAVTGNAHALDQSVLEISVEQPKKGIYTVGLTSVIKVLGQGDAQAAKEAVWSLQSARKVVADARMSQGAVATIGFSR